MKKNLFSLPIIGVAAAGFVGASAALSPALGAIVVTYEYAGEASAGGNMSSTNTLPATGVDRLFGPGDIDTGEPRDFASQVGTGSDSPINFTSGAASAGNASARTQLTVRVAITNDNARASEFKWNALIFAGGVGYATPNLNSAGCNLTAIENCDSFTGFEGVRDGYSAELNFLSTLDGAELFSGDILVDEDMANASFNNIALDNFGLAAQNGSFYQWDETMYEQSLGVFAVGETKVLEFLVTATVASSNGLDCSPNSFENCYFSLAGFGDPPGGQGGGIGMSPNAFFVSFALTSTEIPVPPAMILFATGAAAIAARRRRKKKAD